MPEETVPSETPLLPGALAVLDVVGYHIDREIASVKESGSDRVIYTAPVSGTTRAYIDVRTSSGQIFRIPVDEDIIVNICNTEEVQERCQKAIEGLETSQDNR
jgi:hypothetical protein